MHALLRERGKSKSSTPWSAPDDVLHVPGVQQTQSPETAESKEFIHQTGLFSSVWKAQHDKQSSGC